MWVQGTWGKIDMEATRDSDLSVNPVFVTEDPKIVDILSDIGVVRAHDDRPGIFGLGAKKLSPGSPARLYTLTILSPAQNAKVR